MKLIYATLLSFSLLLLTACAPEVGSAKWCEKMKEKPKGEMSLNEVRDFAMHCIFPKDTVKQDR